MERLKNMGLKKSFLLLSLSCLAVAFLLLGAVIFLCRGIESYYPLGGVEILSDGSIVPLPSPTASQQRILAILNIVQTLSCILFPVGGLIVSVFLFYYLKLKQPISCLQNGIMRIQNNDLDFSLPILSNDEMGQLCAAFEEMRSELLKSNRLLWQQAEERKRLNAAFSHDLRNPITVLKGSVKLLRQGIQDEQTIDRLESYTLRIEQYVEAMSSVQKLEQLSVKPKEIRLSVLQSELQETARLLALSKKVSVLVPSAKAASAGGDDAAWRPSGGYRHRPRLFAGLAATGRAYPLRHRRRCGGGAAGTRPPHGGGIRDTGAGLPAL